MNKLEAFIERQDKIIREDREKTLISLGLTEREYSPDNQKSAKYPHHDYRNGEECYYRDVPMQVTDEEWAQILEKLEAVRQIREREEREKTAVGGSKKFLPIYEQNSSINPKSDIGKSLKGKLPDGRSAIAWLLRVAAWVLGILTLIAGLISAVDVGDPLVFFTSAANAVLRALLFYALAEILDSLADLRATLKNGWKCTHSNK